MNTPELLQIYTYIETKTIQLQLSQSVYFDLFLENLKGRICTMMSSIFFCCKTKTIIWQARKNERTIVYCLPRKKYLAKMNTLFY